jgi:hypothetical protein
LEGKAESDAVEAPPRPRVSRYPGELELEAGVEGAHVLDVHVGRTPEELSARLAAPDSTLRASSTFLDLATAERAVQEAIDANEGRITKWLEGSARDLKPPIKYDAGHPVGQVLSREAWLRGLPPRDSSMLTVVLRRSSTSPRGFVVLTAFPDVR